VVTAVMKHSQRHGDPCHAILGISLVSRVFLLDRSAVILLFLAEFWMH
jgi:hypothetical protein